MSKQNKKRILFIADVRFWAFDNIAKYLKPILSDKYEVTILYSGDYGSPTLLLDDIMKQGKVDFIHFFYRAYLNLLLETCAKDSKVRQKLEDFADIAITTGVPDHLFIANDKDISSHQPLFDFVDNYYTTSQILHDIYSKIKPYTKPWHLPIYDNVAIDESHSPAYENNKNLKVIWVGNSAWGEWYFPKDYDPKGYQTVIVPAMEALEKEIGIEKVIADGKVKKRSKQQIFSLLKEADILLIAANTDGTPLPLLEAMASGCAVISSNTGIAPELLDSEYILERDAKQFVDKVKYLNNNREILTEIKKRNYQKFIDVFLNHQKFSAKWSELIEETIVKNKGRKDRKIEIYNYLKKRKAPLQERVINYVRNSNHLKKIVRYLIDLPGINWGTKQLIFWYNKKKIDDFYSVTQKELKKHHKVKVLALYPSIHKGVCNSTKSLFESSISISIMGKVNDIVGYPDHFIANLARDILNVEAGTLVISGGGNINLSLMQKLACKHKNIYYLWHGSPAQWSDSGHRNEIKIIHKLYADKKLTGIISLKQDLQLCLSQLGIKSYLMQNYTPQFPDIQLDQASKFTIGIWSAYNNWIKNLYPQMMAISMLKRDDFACKTNFNVGEDMRWMIEGKDITTLADELPFQQLMAQIAKTDLTVYVTNTECSPMIALESLGLGVPCLVGPTSALYKADPYLEDMLTVNRVDCPHAIYEAIRKIKDNIVKIRKVLPAFVKKYNETAKKLNADTISKLS